MDYDVLVIGEINLDLIMRGQDVGPEFGQKEKIVDDAVLTLGSSSAIFACQAARLGLRTAFVGVVGTDVFGEVCLTSLMTRGVDTRACISDPALKTGVSIILVRPDADRAILTYPGSIGALKSEQIDRSLFTRARHLHIASYFLLDALRGDLPQVLYEAKRSGMTVSLDTNWDPNERWELGSVLDLADVFLPNEAELLAITRCSDVESALSNVQGRVKLIAVKQGARGAIAADAKARVSCAARPVQVADTVGAGDSFDAGFIYGYLRGWPLPETLKLACACGSLSTRTVGGTTGQPTLEEAMK